VPLRMHTLHIFSYNLPAGTLSSVLKFNLLLKFSVKIFFVQALFQSAEHLYEKREGSGSGAESGRPRNMRICGSGCPTLEKKH
jgi:hypothetical protein